MNGIFIPIPITDLDNQLPTAMANNHQYSEINEEGELVEILPTWRQFAATCVPLFGQIIKVLWHDTNTYIVIECAPSFMLDEQNEVQALRQAAGVPVGDKERPEYAKLWAHEINTFLATVAVENKTVFTDF